MELAPDPDHEAIRGAIRRLCARSGGGDGRACDDGHRFPSDFGRAMAEGEH